MQSRNLPGLSPQEQFHLLRRIQDLEADKLNLTQQVRELQKQTALYRSEINTLSADLRLLEAKAEAERPVVAVGTQVRHRFLEKHRQRMSMGAPQDTIGRARIKRGDWAAHRGRPLVDAWICESGSPDEKRVFKDLYGVPPETMKKWANIPELIKIAGWRASLKSEDALSKAFEEVYLFFLRLDGLCRDARMLERVFDKPEVAAYVEELEEMYAEYEASGALGKRRSWRGR